MPDYSEYEAARDTSVNDAIESNSEVLSEANRSSLETAFLNGCYNDDNSNCLIPEGYEGVWEGVNGAGVSWRGSNPNKPLPPKP